MEGKGSLGLKRRIIMRGIDMSIFTGRPYEKVKSIEFHWNFRNLAGRARLALASKNAPYSTLPESRPTLEGLGNCSTGLTSPPVPMPAVSFYGVESVSEPQTDRWERSRGFRGFFKNLSSIVLQDSIRSVSSRGFLRYPNLIEPCGSIRFTN